MNKDKNLRRKVLTSFQDFLAEPLTFYSIIIALSISIFIVLEGVYPWFVSWTASQGVYWFQENYPIFVTDGDREFSKSFVEWFGGVFMGFLFPLVLVRAWDQFALIDRALDREAQAIKVLLEDILLLDDLNFLPAKTMMIGDLNTYVNHLLDNYDKEHIPANNQLRTIGDSILQGIRASYKELIYRGGGKGASQLDPITSELLDRLNEAIDSRGNRIATFGGGLFSSLKAVAMLTSVIWLIPFYFLDYQSGVFGSFLKLAVTFLIIFVLSMIADLDEPFHGLWKIKPTSWMELREETSYVRNELRQKLREVQVDDNHEENKSSQASARTRRDKLPLLQMLWVGALSLVYLLFVWPKRDQKNR